MTQMIPVATVCTATDHANTHTEVQLSVLPSPAHASSPATTVVALRGDLDVATAPASRERLLAALRPGMRLLVLDLSQVQFCDAAGVAVLIGTQRRAAALGIVIRLAAPRSHVAKVLRITGLDRQLTIHPTLSDALTIGFDLAARADDDHVQRVHGVPRPRPRGRTGAARHIPPYTKSSRNLR